MSRTPNDVSTQIRATLATTIPGLSCEIGTPERKIIDACSEAISEAYVDQYLVGSLLDIDTKSGLELEQFVGIFGFGRLAGKAATGIVRITANTAGISDTTFQLGTTFYTTPGLAGVTATLYYASIQAVVLPAGNMSCDVPVQCTTVGSSGNLPPDSITYLGDVIGGSTVTNLIAMTGGVDIETDSELRQRFKDTLLRNAAGTADFYEALCQQNNNVSRVVVFGPVSLYATQIKVPSVSLPLSTVVHQDVKYAWPGMESVFTNLGQTDETFYSPVDDYTFVGGQSPSFVTNPSGALVVDDVVDLEFQYCTQSSRNDPLSGITNKVDVFVDGVSPFVVQEAAVVTNTPLSASTSSPFYVGNFERVGSAGAPEASNLFMRLGSTPIVSFPPTLLVSGVLYTLGEHYHLLADTTLLAGTQVETSGIEWTPAGADLGDEVALNYVYNQVPELLNAVMGGAKQICTDVLVHQARYRYLRPCLSIEYDRSYSISMVNSVIVGRLQEFFAMMPFGAQIKTSSLCMSVQQTLGVVDVKLTTSTEDPVEHGVQVFDHAADVDPSVTHTTDFKLNDNELAVYQGVSITRVATP